jgi:hypothetical protein
MLMPHMACAFCTHVIFSSGGPVVYGMCKCRRRAPAATVTVCGGGQGSHEGKEEKRGDVMEHGIKKTRWVVFSLVLLAALILLQPKAAFAATENDLREVMGYERFEGEECEQLVKSIIAQCAKDISYNELLDLLDEMQADDYADIKEKTQKKDLLYEEMMGKFRSGFDVGDILTLYSEYASAYQELEGYATDSTVRKDLERIDESDIDARMAYALAIEKTASSTDNIGKIGNDADTFLKNTLYISSVGDDFVSCKVEKGVTVYAPLTGIVTSVQNNRIVLQCGATIEVICENVSRATGIYPGDKVKQGKQIGQTTDTTVTVHMTIDTMPANPLRMYGNRGVHWYETYKNENPWQEDDMDLTDVKEKIEEKEEEPTGSVMTDEYGQTTEITVDGAEDEEDLSIYGETPVLESNPLWQN